MTLADTGIFGLALPAENSPYSPVFGEAVKQKLFKYSIFTIYLHKCAPGEIECEGGSITFGDFDDVHCKPVHAWIPIVSGLDVWQVKIDGFKIGNGDKVDYPVQVCEVSKSSTSFDCSDSHR